MTVFPVVLETLSNPQTTLLTFLLEFLPAKKCSVETAGGGTYSAVENFSHC